MKANFRNLYLDVFWFGILSGSAMAFVTVYAARLGASAFQVSLLTAGPGLVNLALSLPAGRWLEGRPLVRTSFLTSALSRLGYLALVAVPWLFLPEGEIWAIVLLTLLMSIPGTALAISFNSLFADAVPPQWRAEVVGRRNAIMSVSLLATTLISGQLLDRLPFPGGYQFVFALGALGGMMSTYYLGKIVLGNEAPVRMGRALGDLARPGLFRNWGGSARPAGLRFLARSGGRPLLRLDLLRGAFGTFLLAYLVFYTLQYLPVPLFPLAFVNVLDLSNSAIAVGTGLFHAGVLLTSLVMPHLSARFSLRQMIVAGSIAYAIYPALLGLAQGAGLYWLASILGGMIWGVVGAALVNRLMERVPGDDRAAYMALHNLVLNLGILTGSLSGPLLGDWLGIPSALLLAGGLRAFAGLLLWLWA